MFNYSGLLQSFLIISQRRKGAKFSSLRKIKHAVCHFEEREITLETPLLKSPIFVDQRV
jgi:hypothetical protein